MRLGAYLWGRDQDPELYLWEASLCGSCRKEFEPWICHLCRAPVHPKTWEDLGLQEPPMAPWLPEIEMLAERATADQQVLVTELRAAVVHDGLSPGQERIAEEVVRAYVAGGCVESARRLEAARKKA